MYVKYIYEKKNSTFSVFFFGLSKLDTLYHGSFDSHYRPFSPEDYSLSIVVALFLKLLCLKASEKTEQGNFRREIHKSATWAALLASALTSRCNARIQHTKKRRESNEYPVLDLEHMFLCVAVALLFYVQGLRCSSSQWEYSLFAAHSQLHVRAEATPPFLNC